MTATRIGQLVGCSVLMLAILVGGVAAASSMPREGPTSDLVKWEQEKLANDEAYIKAVFFHGDTKLTSAITLWRDYMQPALAKRKRILDEALVRAGGRQLKEAKEILYRAHRQAFAAMAPNIQRIMDNLNYLARLDHSVLHFEQHSLRSLKSAEGRLIRRVNNYFYETATEVIFGYTKKLSDIYQRWDVLDDSEAGELNDEAYYSRQNKDRTQPKAKRMRNGPGPRHGRKNELFNYEIEQLELDYQFIRAEITQAQPKHFFQFAAIHQIYAAIEERERIIYDEMNESSIKRYLEQGRSTLFKAHLRALRIMAPYLKRAFRNIRALESDPHEFRRFDGMLSTIKLRFQRGLDEYFWKYEPISDDEEDSASDSGSDSDDDLEMLPNLNGWNPNQRTYPFSP